ncbi:MAG: hypothetical protein L0228_06300 [Planctomycetes bacterium]|nr:hypothetical protein [Planctomycetota bacterium]
MAKTGRITTLGFISLTLLAIASCRYGPSPVSQPGIDPSSAGSLAMDEYDTNGDGQVAGGELEKAPGLKAALARLDTNGDKAVSAEEVAERVEKWQAMQTGLTSFSFTVTLDGIPLQDATVTFVPEVFLGDDIKAAVSTTNLSGRGKATVPKEDRPDPQATPPGMYFGMYLVKISKIVGGAETIPARYNGPTTIGQEVAPDVSEIAGNRVVYELKSK